MSDETNGRPLRAADLSPILAGKLDTKRAAKRYGCTVGHLARLRVQGRGPEFELIKGRVYYTPESIDAALAATASQRSYTSTSQYVTPRARRAERARHDDAMLNLARIGAHHLRAMEPALGTVWWGVEITRELIDAAYEMEARHA